MLGTDEKIQTMGLEFISYGRFFTFHWESWNSNDVYDRTDELGEVFENSIIDDSDIQGRVTFSIIWKRLKSKFQMESLLGKMFP